MNFPTEKHLITSAKLEKLRNTGQQVSKTERFWLLADMAKILAKTERESNNKEKFQDENHKSFHAETFNY